LRFFFPDSQDQVDPAFDFHAERSSEFKVRQRDDRYAHEVLRRPAYDGLLVSKPIIDGLASSGAKYTMAQRHRLYRLGVHGFYRLDQPGWSIATMGDCGAFTYIREDVPPYTVDEVIDFYEGCGFDFGISVDHVIFGYDPTDRGSSVPEWKRRQTLTLELAAEFRSKVASRRCRFKPLGVAQGWSPRSYAAAVAKLQRMGYRYIALGGMVPLKTWQIQECLEAINDIRFPETGLHLLGISRCEHLPAFAPLGVISFDSTSPLRQAFKDDRDNYYASRRNYPAIRVPQVDGNAHLKADIKAGRVDQSRARLFEQLSLRRLRDFDLGTCSTNAVIEALSAYAEVVEPDRDRAAEYRELLEAAPWKRCPCGICERVGIQVVIFRGTERNKRRGFHNLYVFSRRLKKRPNAEAIAPAV
jgi:hypothetical protein